ncbi:MAG: glycosyltransferase [Nitrososphaerota archaeon]
MHSVSFGIPSFNEPKNVLRLINMIAHQVLPPSINVEEIIIIDDSDYERYNELINGLNHFSALPIQVIHNSSRQGVAAAWNNIFSRSRGDVLVLYDADVFIRPETTWRLVNPLLMDNELGLVAAYVKALSNSSIAGMMSTFIADWLNEIRTSYPNSKYLAMGRGLAVRTSIVKKICIPKDVISIDLYLQLYTLRSGYKVHFASDAVVEFKAPSLLRESISQVIRGYFGHKQLKMITNKLLINPKFAEEIFCAVKTAKHDPRGAFATIIGFIYLFFLFSKLFRGSSNYLWDVALTSK